MTVHNCAEYLDEAIASIVNQTYRDFEFIIINDASPDNAGEIIDRYARKDKRIRVITNKKNINFVVVGNQILKEGKGEYFAFAHGDDIYHPQRLEMQLNFLENHKEIGMVSSRQYNGPNKSFYRSMDKVFNVFNVKVHRDDHVLKSYLLRAVPIGMPVLMWRRSLLEKNDIEMNIDYSGAEDLLFYIDLMPYTKFAKLGPKLVMIRQHDKRISTVYREKGKRAHVRAIKLHHEKFGIINDDETLYNWIFAREKKFNELPSVMREKICQLVCDLIRIKRFYGYPSPSWKFKYKCVGDLIRRGISLRQQFRLLLTLILN